MDISIGIHDIALATGSCAMDLAELAAHHGADVDKYYIGLGQRTQSVLAADEDIVTMAAAAAEQILHRHGTDGIRTILLATESGIDQSKSAAVYVQDLLGLPAAVRAVELKQACHAGTSALQMAAGLVARRPGERVLVIATDVARYDMDSSGEATQGGAAVAMLISADPAVAVLDGESGLHTADIMDFWRPNHRATPLVDGKLSVAAYQDALELAWKDYESRGGARVESFAAFCYHQPFTRMAYKAHARLLEINGIDGDTARLERDLGPTTRYNRLIGNSYTASLYLALLSALEHDTDLAGRSIALFSYGSGCVAEFFALRVVEGYRAQLRAAANDAALTRREVISYARYRALRAEAPPADGSDWRPEVPGARPYRLAAVTNNMRQYR